MKKKEKTLNQKYVSKVFVKCASSFSAGKFSRKNRKERDLTQSGGVYADALLVGFMILLQDKNLVYVFQMTLCSILIVQKETEMRHP